jgi:acetyl esterase/lipase
MDVLSAIPPPADHRIHYGPDEFQFGDLRLPDTAKGSVPLVIFLHGGWWKSAYDLEYGGHLCAALKSAGVATWSIEYRRVGSTGGGWPTTFQDVARGCDHVATLVKSYALDLNHVIVMGHSAGGHLAFWLAGRHHVPDASPIHTSTPKVTLRGVIALAGAVDLRLTCDLAGSSTFAHDKHEVYSLMGGSPAEFPERYRAGNPGDLLPLGVRQILFQGSEDDQIPPELPGRWAERARQQGDGVDVAMIASADHFDVVDPGSKAWPTVQAAVLKMLQG